MSTAVDRPEPLKRKCAIAQVLPVGVIQLLASAPHNESVRNVLLAHLKVPVPEELKSYKDIQDWIEFNIDPAANVMKAAPGQKSGQVQILVTASDLERGACLYVWSMRGHGNVELSEQEILDSAAAAEDEEDFWSSIREKIYETDVSEQVSMEKVDGSERYSYHEFSENDGIGVDIESAGQAAVMAVLERLDQETYERLF